MTSFSPIEAAIARATVPPLDTHSVRDDFPALHQQVHGKPLVYLDSAATALKPQAVIDAVVHTYSRDCANIHRAVHTLSQNATATHEAARESVRRFIGAAKTEEVVFTAGATAAINLVAQTWGTQNLGPGDEVLITELAHHANIVPWQLVCERTGARLVVAPINERGEVEESAFAEKLSSKTKLVSFAHISNSLGTVLPVARFAKLAHDAGALVLVDGSQGVVHGPVDVAKLDVDFYVFSGHKLYAPSGTGVLYGKEALLEAMPPWQGGGDMIDEVRFEQTTYNDLPFKFEAGTPNIAGFAGLGAAIRYLEDLGWDSITNHEDKLLAYGTEALEQVDGLRIIGNAANKAGVLSFVLDGIHPTDAGTLLDAEGIAIRTGHHCAQPVMQHFGVSGTARASLALYNTTSEIDALVTGLAKVRKLFG